MFSWNELWSTVLTLVVKPCVESNLASVSANAFLGTSSE